MTYCELPNRNNHIDVLCKNRTGGGDKVCWLCLTPDQKKASMEVKDSLEFKEAQDAIKSLYATLRDYDTYPRFFSDVHPTWAERTRALIEDHFECLELTFWLWWKDLSVMGGLNEQLF